MSIIAVASFFSRKILADGESRLGMKVPGMRSWPKLLAVAQLLQGGNGFSQLAGDIECVAHASAAAQHRGSGRNRAEYHDVSQNPVGRLCRVSTGERDLVAFGQLQQSGDEALNPLLR